MKNLIIKPLILTLCLLGKIKVEVKPDGTLQARLDLDDEFLDELHERMDT